MDMSLEVVTLPVAAVAIVADSRRPTAAAVKPEHAVAELAAHEPGGSASALPANALRVRAIRIGIEQRPFRLPQEGRVEHNLTSPVRIAERL